MASSSSMGASSAQGSSLANRNGDLPQEQAFRISDVDMTEERPRGRTPSRTSSQRRDSPLRAMVGELLAPTKGIKKPPRSPSPRPTIGGLRPRSASSSRVPDLGLCLLKGKAEAIPEDEPEKPIRFVIKGERKPGGGYGKVLVPPIKREEMELGDSSQSSPARRHPRVQRHRQPPAIKGLPGDMEFSDEEDKEEEEEKPPTVESLKAELAEARQKINHLDEKVAEGELARMEWEDKMEVLRRALCAKLKRLFKATGFPELYDP